MYNKIFLKKTLIEFGSSHLYAYFGTFCIQISQSFDVQWYFKLLEEFEIYVIFLRKHWFYHFQTFFKDSLCLLKLTWPRAHLYIILHQCIQSFQTIFCFLSNTLITLIPMGIFNEVQSSCQVWKVRTVLSAVRRRSNSSFITLIGEHMMCIFQEES